MKNGEECDLLERLAKNEEFGLSKDEMDAILDPKLYIGRCPEQVTQLLDKVRPLLADVSISEVEINL
jgi:adenylosuccinate lyase